MPHGLDAPETHPSLARSISTLSHHSNARLRLMAYLEFDDEPEVQSLVASHPGYICPNYRTYSLNSVVWQCHEAMAYQLGPD